MTGAALAMLCGEGIGAADTQVARGLAFLKGKQDAATGGIVAGPFVPRLNAPSNAWALIGLNACGVSDDAAAGGRSISDFLLSLRRANGSFKYVPEDGETSPQDMNATEAAVRALSGAAFFADRPPAAALASGRLGGRRDAGADRGRRRRPRRRRALLRGDRSCGSTLDAVLWTAGCVSDSRVTDGRVTSIGGVVAGPGRAWVASVAGGGVAPAGEQQIGAGDNVSLELRTWALAAGAWSVGFGGQARETIGAPRTITLTATTDGVRPARVRAADDFLITADTCTQASLDEGEACSVSVRFAPAAAGARAATLLITDAAGDAISAVEGAGTGRRPGRPRRSRGCAGPAGHDRPRARWVRRARPARGRGGRSGHGRLDRARRIAGSAGRRPARATRACRQSELPDHRQAARSLQRALRVWLTRRGLDDRAARPRRPHVRLRAAVPAACDAQTHAWRLHPADRARHAARPGRVMAVRLPSPWWLTKFAVCRSIVTTPMATGPRRFAVLRRSALAAGLLVAAAAAPAVAAPADVHVRVEGEQRTLFDRVVRTDGHDVRTASDTAPRRCDGTDNGANPMPGPTATAATVDAMTTIGQGFDGAVVPRLRRLLPHPLGPGCGGQRQRLVVGHPRQPRLHAGRRLPVPGPDGRRGAVGLRRVQLASLPVAGGAATTTVGVADHGHRHLDREQHLGRPDQRLRRIRARRSRGSAPTRSRRRRTPCKPGTSDAAGKAVVVFQRPGWQRLKARDQQPGEHPVAIASNSVDVCVHAADGSGCDGPPPSQVPVWPGGPIPSRPRPQRRHPRRPRPRRPPLRRTRAPRLRRRRRPSRRCGSRRPRSARATVAADASTVRWGVLDAGPGVRGWEISARKAGSTNWTVRARGAQMTSAVLRCRPERSGRCASPVTDALGRAATTDIGTVLVPIDDRSRALRYRGDWSRKRDAAGWRATVSEGAKGAPTTVRLPAGRPLLRSAAARARRGSRWRGPPRGLPDRRRTWRGAPGDGRAPHPRRRRATACARRPGSASTASP